ncbi:hypothetical protein K523DRAFT_358760, partial [Schizophyllum commune Tattone D]
ALGGAQAPVVVQAPGIAQAPVAAAAAPAGGIGGALAANVIAPIALAGGPVAQAPVAAITNWFGPEMVSDPEDIRLGVGYLVTPNHDLVAPLYYWAPGPKYYAVTRGKYVGIFNTSGFFGLATNNVSCPLSLTSRNLAEVLGFFNAARRANMLSFA